MSMPKIDRKEVVAETALFRVEQLQLTFANGEQRIYERLGNRGTGRKAVMIVPMLDQHQVVMIKEYAAGTENYQLTLPKGLVEVGETLHEGANRELKEEAGYGAQQLRTISEFTLSPNYMSHSMSVVLAQGLYPESLPGDEPEPMEKEIIDLRNLYQLMQREDFTEARAIAALYLVRDILQQEL
ncbi:ADP compounds hydrolase NudE [Zooshikella marina]|uniref:ADP compounds hydrolase NudE n=1 Tax=Zooshikella ganghwensis TaxID=202772 RepID=A0A4P9VGR2_9GAMM|nr:ADP compounds hydrolase NudE [Zooshikella ganghwensis]MBU2706540.1 ADP compounds hydrolase NudE [Zooshikella ganghwensis]RDH42345.1 ADP compounds hydrolase NudE [Zooshikella ganghwensis]